MLCDKVPVHWCLSLLTCAAKQHSQRAAIKGSLLCIVWSVFRGAGRKCTPATISLRGKMKSSGLTTLICLTSPRNALGAAVLLNHLKYTALPHTSPSCHSVITRRGALNRSTLPVSRVSLPSHTSQLAVDPLFLSSSEYGWMTGLLKKPRLTLTNLAVFLFFF